MLASAAGDYGKPRPALVVQSDLFNETHASVTVCPITSTLVDAPLFRVSVRPARTNGLPKPSQVMVDKVQTLRRERIARRVVARTTILDGKHGSRGVLRCRGAATHRGYRCRGVRIVGKGHDQMRDRVAADGRRERDRQVAAVPTGEGREDGRRRRRENRAPATERETIRAEHDDYLNRMGAHHVIYPPELRCASK